MNPFTATLLVNHFLHPKKRTSSKASRLDTVLSLNMGFVCAFFQLVKTVLSSTEMLTSEVDKTTE